jgi:hypothetical protein
MPLRSICRRRTLSLPTHLLAAVCKQMKLLEKPLRPRIKICAADTFAFCLPTKLLSTTANDRCGARWMNIFSTIMRREIIKARKTFCCFRRRQRLLATRRFSAASGSAASYGITIKRPLEPDQYFGHTGKEAQRRWKTFAQVLSACSVLLNRRQNGLSF